MGSDMGGWWGWRGAGGHHAVLRGDAVSRLARPQGPFGVVIAGIHENQGYGWLRSTADPSLLPTQHA